MFYSKGSKAKGTSFNSLPSQVMGWHQSVQRFMSHTISYLSTKEKWSTKENTALFFVCIWQNFLYWPPSFMHCLVLQFVLYLHRLRRVVFIQYSLILPSLWPACYCVKIGFRSNETWLLSGDSISPPIIRPKSDPVKFRICSSRAYEIVSNMQGNSLSFKNCPE